MTDRPVSGASQGTGGSPESNCDKLLNQIYFFIDNELDSADAAQIKQHIEDCGPCLDEVALERLVKKLVARSCTERAPAELRQRVVFSIRQVQLQVTQVQTDPTEGTR
jgi:mycothiol system anti-sigma-R factor